MRVRFTQSARKHRIGRARALHVMEHVTPSITTNDRGEIEYGWLGVDDRGVELEITGAIVGDGSLLVFHVMPAQYRRT